MTYARVVDCDTGHCDLEQRNSSFFMTLFMTPTEYLLLAPGVRGDAISALEVAGEMLRGTESKVVGQLADRRVGFGQEAF